MSTSQISSTPKSSVLVKLPPFDEEAINREFQEEYDALEQRSQQLDLNFQNLLKDLRIWVSASVVPISEEAKLKYPTISTSFDNRIAAEVENIKITEGNQENVAFWCHRVTDSSCVSGSWNV